MSVVPITNFSLQDVCNTVLGHANAGDSLSSCDSYSSTHGTFHPDYSSLSGMLKYQKYTDNTVVVTTNAATSVSILSAYFSFNVGGVGQTIPILECGIIFSQTHTEPVFNGFQYDFKHTATNIYGDHSFSQSLTQNTLYYYRAYCTTEYGIIYGLTNSVFTLNFTIGTPYLGGIIAYVDVSGTHGFVAKDSDVVITNNAHTGNNTTFAWWNGSNAQPLNLSNGGTTLDSDYSVQTQGFSNTISIIYNRPWSWNGNADNYIAAYVSMLNEIDSWYLPSKAELEQMYSVKSSISLNSGFYWSSTTVSGSYNAYRLNNSNGSITAATTNLLYAVRQIKSF